MNKVFLIDGGAGRVIAAIPALERYIKENPDHDVKICIYGWDTLFWSNKLLQDKTFNTNDKGVFENIIFKADEIVSPEPYRLPAYIHQKASLSEAFDILINGSPSKDKLIPRLYISNQEKASAESVLLDVKKYQENTKNIVIQPFGSTANFHSNGKSDSVVDGTSRSFSLEMFAKICGFLREKKYNLILFADQKFHFKEDNFTYKLTGDLRTHMSVISVADYFIGCDSVGQHMARAFNKPGTVILGSTFAESISYPDWFNIVDKYKDKKTYSPMRISDLGCNLADRNNSECMDYTTKEVDDICSKILEDIKKKVK